MASFEEEIGQRVKQLRGGRTQVAYASATGLAQSVICRCERGEAVPALRNLLAIATEGGVSLDWLCAGRGPGIGAARPRGRSDRA